MPDWRNQSTLSVIQKKHPRKDITRFLFENPTAYFNTKVPLSAFRFWNLRHMIIRERVEKRQEFWRRTIVQGTRSLETSGNANDYKAVRAWEGRLEGRACKLPNSLPSSKTGHPELDCVTLTSTSMRIFQSTKLVKSSYWNCCLVLQTALITIKRELNGYNILRMWCCLHLTQASDLLLVPSRDRHGWVRGSCNEFNPLTSEYRHILQFCGFPKITFWRRVARSSIYFRLSVPIIRQGNIQVIGGTFWALEQPSKPLIPTTSAVVT